MIESKLFEVRDSMTFIPVMATLMAPNEIHNDVTVGEKWLMRRAGYGGGRCVILCRLNCAGVNDNASYDPYSWGAQTRTMTVAHNYIIEFWDKLESGDVIDVEYILGLRTEPKISERLDHA